MMESVLVGDEVIVAPAGTVQAYVEPAEFITEYEIPIAFGQTVTGPVIGDVTGMLFVTTAILTGVPAPHVPVSVTEIVPPVGPKVTVIEFVFVGVEVIVAPAGTVQA